MTHIHKLISVAPDWTDQTWTQRIDDAASLLYLNGYITMSQRAKISQKIERQYKDAIANGEIKPVAPPATTEEPR